MNIFSAASLIILVYEVIITYPQLKIHVVLFLKGCQGLRRPVGFHKYFFNCFFLIFEKVFVEKAKVESIRLTELEKHTRHFKNLIVNPTVLVDAKETLGTNYVIDA